MSPLSTRQKQNKIQQKMQKNTQKKRKVHHWKKPVHYCLQTLFDEYFLVPAMRPYLKNHQGLIVQARNYLKHLEVLNKGDKTIQSQRRFLYTFCVFCHERGVFLVTQAGREVLEQWQRHLFLKKHLNRSGQEVSLSYQSQYNGIMMLKQFFRFLSRLRLITHNPSQELELPKRPRRLPREWLLVEEVEKVLSLPDTTTALGVRDRAILEVLYSTGIRRTEVCNLFISDIHPQNGYLFIRQGKGKRDRVVPLGSRALSWVLLWINKHRLAYCDLSLTNEHVFLSISGQPFSGDLLGSLVKGYLIKGGIMKAGSCHLFRHTFATLMLEAGADLRSIQMLLGHARLETTEVYTHIAIHRLKEIHTRLHPAEQVYRSSEQGKSANPAMEQKP